MVFFNGIVIRVWHGYGQETANSCGRFEKRAHLQTVLSERGVYLPCHRIDNEFRCVKSGQDRCLDALGDGLPHRFREIGICVYKFLQLTDWFVHVAAYGSVCADVQHFLDATETRISGQYGFFLLCSLSALHLDFHCGFYGFHIGYQ